MKVSTFQAKDMREALNVVKEQLGADAVILSTRSIRDKGRGGELKDGAMIEVTACPAGGDGSAASAAPAAASPPAGATR
ncbi:MAG: hypothetical protein H7831_07540, partial [Magnetococcus sp. WYHC-3]